MEAFMLHNPVWAFLLYTGALLVCGAGIGSALRHGEVKRLRARLDRALHLGTKAAGNGAVPVTRAFWQEYKPQAGEKH